VDYSILVGFDENSHEIVVGMIDYLRQYDLVKKGERIVKSGYDNTILKYIHTYIHIYKFIFTYIHSLLHNFSTTLLF
jgi:hypothetical protein